MGSSISSFGSPVSFTEAFDIADIFPIEPQNGHYSTENIWRLAEKNNCEFVNQILEDGIDVDIQDSDGFTPLIWASTSGAVDMVCMLLEWGANINFKDKFGWTSLIWAAHNGHFDVVENLLNNGADTSIRTKQGETAAVCARNGHFDDIADLLENYKIYVID
jgi:ankyrin repeat protein